MALTTDDVEFIEGEDVNTYVHRSKDDQEAKGLSYGSSKETCPVTALREWLQAAQEEVEGPFEGVVPGRIDRRERDDGPVRLYRLKRHVEAAGLDADEYSAHSLRADFITPAIRAGTPERRTKEYSGHSS